MRILQLRDDMEFVRNMMDLWHLILWPFGSAKNMTFHHFRWVFHYDYPLVNIYITMERSTIFHGKIHYNSAFSIAMFDITRGYIPLNPIKPPFSYGKSPFIENLKQSLIPHIGLASPSVWIHREPGLSHASKRSGSSFKAWPPMLGPGPPRGFQWEGKTWNMERLPPDN